MEHLLVCYCLCMAHYLVLFWYCLWQDSHPEYNLFATIVHSGYSPESGHYYAYIKVSLHLSCSILYSCFWYSGLTKQLCHFFFPDFWFHLCVYRMQWVAGIAATILMFHFQPCRGFCQRRFTFFSFLVLMQGSHPPAKLLRPIM